MAGTGQNIHLRGALQAICHLAGDKTLPNQLIQLILVICQAGLYLIRATAKWSLAEWPRARLDRSP